MTLSDTMLDTEPFSALVGEQIIQLIFEKAPTKVFTRIAKSLEHYTRAARLRGIDEEMGVICNGSRLKPAMLAFDADFGSN